MIVVCLFVALFASAAMFDNRADVRRLLKLYGFTPYMVRASLSSKHC